MKKTIGILMVLMLFATTASAVQVKLGTASGGLMVHYNNVDVSGAGGIWCVILSQ